MFLSKWRCLSLGKCVCVDLRINSYFASYTRAHTHTHTHTVQCKFHALTRPNDLREREREREAWAGWLASVYF